MEYKTQLMWIGTFLIGVLLGASFVVAYINQTNPKISKEEAQDLAASTAFKLSSPGVAVMASQTNETDDFYAVSMQFSWENGANYSATGFITKDGKYFTDHLWDVQQVKNATFDWTE